MNIFLQHFSEIAYKKERNKCENTCINEIKESINSSKLPILGNILVNTCILQKFYKTLDLHLQRQITASIVLSLSHVPESCSTSGFDTKLNVDSALITGHLHVPESLLRFFML